MRKHIFPDSTDGQLGNALGVQTLRGLGKRRKVTWQEPGSTAMEPSKLEWHSVEFFLRQLKAKML